MKICFPINTDDGIKSLVNGYFGNSPLFLIYNTQTLTSRVLTNAGRDTSTAECSPLALLTDKGIDILVVSGIGNSALKLLNDADIRVYQSQGITVGDNIEAIKSTGLPEFLEPSHNGKC
ncbi:MAG: NifB/NifX family molybdenum-iron cluster-binding protein [Candidatus Kapaibacterium sp.]